MIAFTAGLFYIGINQTMACGRKKYFNKRLKRRHLLEIVTDPPGLLLIYYMTGCLIFGLALSAVLFYNDLDPYVTTFTKLGLTMNPYLLIVSYLLSTFTIVYLVLHNLTVIVFLAIFSYLAIQSYLKFLIIIYRKSINSKIVLSYYVQIRLVYNLYSECVHSSIFIMTVYTLGLLTLFLWLAVNCANVVPLFIVLCFGAAFIGGLGLIVFLMQIFADTRILSGVLIKQAKGSFCYSTTHNVGTSTLYERILKRKWLSQPELPVNCGRRFACSKDAIMNYLDVLSSLLTNSLLLFQV
jgi:hypothetical protein